MDPLLIIDGIIVGVAAMLAYITAIAKKVLKARLGKLEKARDVLFQRYILVHRHLKAIDGTRKLYSGWVTEKHKKLDELALELQEWESKAKVEAGEEEFEVREAMAEDDDGSEGGADNEPQEETEGDSPEEARDHPERPAADLEEDETAEENGPGGSEDDSEKTTADQRETEEEKKDIKVNFRHQQGSLYFDPDR